MCFEAYLKKKTIVNKCSGFSFIVINVFIVSIWFFLSDGFDDCIIRLLYPVNCLYLLAFVSSSLFTHKNIYGAIHKWAKVAANRMLMYFVYFLKN